MSTPLKITLTGTLFIVAIILSCRGPEHNPVVKYGVDINCGKEIAIDKDRLLPLDSSDSALFYEVDELIELGNKSVVLSRNLIKMFDSSTGRFLGNIDLPKIGISDRPPMITRIWNSADTLKVFEANNARIHSYDFQGKFLSSIHFVPKGEADHPLNFIYFLELPDSYSFLAFNNFTDGTTPNNPMFSLYDSTLTLVRDIPGREMTTGYMSTNLAYADKHEVLYWETIRDTIFSVTKEGVRPKFVLDFGEKRSP